MRIAKLIGLIILIVFYAGAGVNHFVHPDGYIKIVPGYIPYPVQMNMIAGVCEIVFAMMMVPPVTRPLAGWLIVLMLAAFLPVHITMALDAPMQLGNLHVTTFWAWARVAFQPVLMYWAWWNTRV